MSNTHTVQKITKFCHIYKFILLTDRIFQFSSLVFICLVKWLVKVRKTAKIRKRYNQIPHLTQNIPLESNKNTIKITNKSHRSALSQQVTTRWQWTGAKAWETQDTKPLWHHCPRFRKKKTQKIVNGSRVHKVTCHHIGTCTCPTLISTFLRCIHAIRPVHQLTVPSVYLNVFDQVSW